jgi:hypothetical protein
VPTISTAPSPSPSSMPSTAPSTSPSIAPTVDSGFCDVKYGDDGPAAEGKTWNFYTFGCRSRVNGDCLSDESYCDTSVNSWLPGSQGWCGENALGLSCGCCAPFTCKLLGVTCVVGCFNLLFAFIFQPVAFNTCMHMFCFICIAVSASPVPVPTEIPTAVPSVTSQSTNYPSPSPTLCLSKFSQCGGETWSGGTVCCENLVCTLGGQYYASCKPTTSSSTPSPTESPTTATTPSEPPTYNPTSALSVGSTTFPTESPTSSPTAMLAPVKVFRRCTAYMIIALSCLYRMQPHLACANCDGNSS